MNIRRKLKAHAEVHTGALNDILFILLLFFLIVSTLANPNVVKVDNPKGKNDTKVKQSVVISIDKNRQMYLQQKPIMADNFNIKGFHSFRGKLLVLGIGHVPVPKSRLWCNLLPVLSLQIAVA